jgi:hypothetical protein
VNKAVEFVPHMATLLGLTEVAVTEPHWPVRQQGAVVQE